MSLQVTKVTCPELQLVIRISQHSNSFPPSVPRLPIELKINQVSHHIFPQVRGSSHSPSNYNNTADEGEKFSLR